MPFSFADILIMLLSTLITRAQQISTDHKLKKLPGTLVQGFNEEAGMMCSKCFSDITIGNGKRMIS